MKLTKRLFAIFTGVICLVVSSAAFAASVNITSTPGALPADGGSVQLSVSITNDSSFPMENIAITNSGNRFFETSGVVIQPGENTTFS